MRSMSIPVAAFATPPSNGLHFVGLRRSSSLKSRPFQDPLVDALHARPLLQTSPGSGRHSSLYSAGNTLGPVQFPPEASISTEEPSAILDPALSSSVLTAPISAESLVIKPGKPDPLGPSLGSNEESSIPTVNFAIFSQHATSVKLCLFNQDGDSWDPPSNPDEAVPDVEIELDPSKNRTGDIWHLALEGLPLSNVLYSYKVGGPTGWDQGHRFDPSALLLDPYAPLVEGRRVFGDASKRLAPFFGAYDFVSAPFDWEDDEQRTRVKEEDVIVYEMNVRAFTADKSSGLPEAFRGSYLGLVDKIPHLVELGVNSVELLPVFEYDEFEFQRRENPRQHMLNTWGYSTVNFFAPMSRYASLRPKEVSEEPKEAGTQTGAGVGAVAASREFKQMVKELHKAGIEVILDVVYNHTNESDDQFPYLTSFRGIDNLVYYIVQKDQYVQLANYAGCGNTLNCNHPVVMRMILDSLRHWVTEYHVDGFRFDLASVLCRGTDGAPLSSPPLIRAISKDPVLSRCKLISEPWDCAGLYLVGKFPNWDRWAEWNGKFRDDVRCFIKGDKGMKGKLATRLAGSADLYHVNNRKPYHSINFVIAHDGFTLADLVSYNEKHNEANGEQGRDGSNDNFSWNCGVEGPTDNPDILALRGRQIRNFHLALMLSQGTPMMLMGDEYGLSRNGNNNSYGHDNELNHFQWGKLESSRPSLFRFFSLVNKFRAQQPTLGQPNFLSESDITWHENNWDDEDSCFLAFTLHGSSRGASDIYIAFNAHSFYVTAALPSPPSSLAWHRVVDTNLPSPKDINLEAETVIQGGSYNMCAYSCIVLLAK